MASSTTSTARKNPHPLRNPPVNVRKEVGHPHRGAKLKSTRQLHLRNPGLDSPKTPIADPILEAVKELNPDPESPPASHCYESALSISFSQYSEPARDSFVTARVSEATTAACSVKNVREDPSESSDVSDESNGVSVNKPHKANDSRWEAIRAVRAQKGESIGLSNFRLLKRLGCGDIGSVHLVELSGTRCYFAMKIMDKEALEAKKKLPRARTEKKILQCLDHPFLPTLYTHFETERFSCLVMEFCPGGDLHTLRQRQPGRYFSEKAARFYAAEVLLALEYLHMLGIIYRDLKPENVLVREDGHIMLSDFDLSLRCSVSPTLIKSSRHVTFDMPSKSSSGHCIQPPSCMQPTCFAPPRFLMNNRSKDAGSLKSNLRNNGELSPELLAEPTGARSMSFVGTHEYLAPEIIKGEGHGSAVDWWTFGIFLYELLFGKTPFRGSGNRATLFNVVGEPLTFPEGPPVSFAARDLIRGLLVKEPQQRLAYRRGATEVKQHPFFESVSWALIRCASPPEIPKFSKKSNDHFHAFAVGGESSESSVDVKPSDRYLDIDFF